MTQKTRLKEKRTRRERHHNQVAHASIAKEQKLDHISTSRWLLDVDTFGCLDEFLTGEELVKVASVSKHWNKCAAPIMNIEQFSFFRKYKTAEHDLNSMYRDTFIYEKSNKLSLTLPTQLAAISYACMLFEEQHLHKNDPTFIPSLFAKCVVMFFIFGLVHAAQAASFMFSQSDTFNEKLSNARDEYVKRFGPL